MAWVAAAPYIAAGVSSIAGYLMNKNAKKQSAAQKTLEGQLTSNLQASSPMALDSLRKASSGYDRAEGYYGNLARSRESALNVLAPQLRQSQTMLNAGQRARAASGDMRSGSAVESNLAGLDSLHSSREDSILNLRNNAEGALAGIAGERAQMGSSLLGQSTGGSLGLLGSILQRQNSEYFTSRDAGSSVFELMKFLQPYMSGGGRPAGGGATTGIGASGMPSAGGAGDWLRWANGGTGSGGIGGRP